MDPCFDLNAPKSQTSNYLQSLGGPRAHCAAGQGWLFVCNFQSPLVDVPTDYEQHPE